MPVSAYCFDEPVCSICEFRLRDASSIKINRLSTSLLCGFWGDFASAYFSRSVEKSFPVFLERHASVCQKQWRAAADSRLDHFLSVDATDICGTICWLFFFYNESISRVWNGEKLPSQSFSSSVNLPVFRPDEPINHFVHKMSNENRLNFLESQADIFRILVCPTRQSKIREILYLQWSQTE